MIGARRGGGKNDSMLSVCCSLFSSSNMAVCCGWHAEVESMNPLIPVDWQTFFGLVRAQLAQLRSLGIDENIPTWLSTCVGGLIANVRLPTVSTDTTQSRRLHVKEIEAAVTSLTYATMLNVDLENPTFRDELLQAVCPVLCDLP